MLYQPKAAASFRIGESLEKGRHAKVVCYTKFCASLQPLPLACSALQRRSNQLTQSAVSAVLKETSCVLGSDCIESLTHGLHQRFPTPGFRLT